MKKVFYAIIAAFVVFLADDASATETKRTPIVEMFTDSVMDRVVPYIELSDRKDQIDCVLDNYPAYLDALRKQGNIVVDSVAENSIFMSGKMMTVQVAYFAPGTISSPTFVKISTLALGGGQSVVEAYDSAGKAIADIFSEPEYSEWYVGGKMPEMAQEFVPYVLWTAVVDSSTGNLKVENRSVPFAPDAIDETGTLAAIASAMIPVKEYRWTGSRYELVKK